MFCKLCGYSIIQKRHVCILELCISRSPSTLTWAWSVRRLSGKTVRSGFTATRWGAKRVARKSVANGLSSSVKRYYNNNPNQKIFTYKIHILQP